MFKEYIFDCYEEKKYTELCEIYNYIDIDKLDYELLSIFAISCYRNKQPNESKALILKLDELNKIDNHLIFEILALIYYQENDLQSALLNFKKALELSPNLGLATLNRFILTYRVNGIFDQDYFEKALVHAKTHVKNEYLRNIAYILLNEKEYKKASEYLSLVIKKDNRFNYYDYITQLEIQKFIPSVDNQIKKPSREDYFDREFVSNNSDTLLVTLSSGNGYILRGFDYHADRLNIVEKIASYYCFSVQEIVNYISELVKLHKYQKISIVGTSKAGLGVIMIINKLQTLIAGNIQIKAVSCSPQLCLYPINPNLVKIPSYRVISQYMDINNVIRKEFERAMKLVNFEIKNNIQLTIFYGRYYLTDKIEIDSINNRIKNKRNVKVIGLDYSGHGSMIPLTIPEGKTKEHLAKKYAALPVDEDFAALGGMSEPNIVEEIFEIYSDPTMRLKNFLC